jgi:hypothetical protein
MLICRDLTQVTDNVRLQEELKATNQMNSYVAHEMLTPLKCIEQLTAKVESSHDTTAENKRHLKIVSQTIQLLLINMKEQLD